uniref:Uncharacterized protein n=1 Tax=Oryza punctata TaxID=4537 RepID=A0A0E0KFU3_ORYPU
MVLADGEKLDSGDRWPTWLPTARAWCGQVPTATAVSSSPVHTRAGASASSRWPSSYPQAQSRPTELLNSRFSGVPELCLSSTEEHARLHRTVLRSTPSTPRCSRIVLDAYALLPAACHYQASRQLQSFSPPIAPVIVVGLLPTATAQRPPPFSLSVVGHRTPFP